MRRLPVKSSAGSGSDQGYTPEKRRQMIAVAAYYHAERRGFRGGDELSDWLEAEAEVEHLLEAEPGNDPKTSAKHRFQQKIESQLKECDARLDELKVKARDAKAEIRAEFEVQLEALAGKRALVQEKLQELRRHGEWAWEDLKEGAEKSWSELREAIKRSASLFK
jgi:hypothetical protein